MQDITRELNFLSSIISQLQLPGSESKYATVSNSILSLMLKGYDLSPLAEQIIKLLPMPYPPFKRIICSYLIRYAPSISNLNIIATNSFLKDFDDPNPYVRRLVIRTVCRIPCLHELACQLLTNAFSDTSSYVRSTAASSSTLIINDDNLDSMQSIIDKLYDMIRDPDPSVVSSSLDALDVILRSEGGIVITPRLARYLFRRISEFQEWHFTTVCRVLKKYIPKDNDELVSYLNFLDDSLSNSSLMIFNVASDLALHYVSVLKKNYDSDIVQQIAPLCKFLLHHSCEELLCETLEISKKYITLHEKYFIPFYKLFFCHFNDPTFVKIKKLQIVGDLVSPANLHEIGNELLLYCYCATKEVSVESLKSFIKYLYKHSVSINIIETFMLLADIQFNNLNEELIIAVGSSKLDDKDYFKTLFLPILSEKSSRITSEAGKLVILKLIAKHGKYIETSPYVIEHFMENSLNLQNENIVLNIILASVQLFLFRPAEMQLLLGNILQFASKSDSLLLRKVSMIYQHLLENISSSQNALLTKIEEENL